MAHFFCGLEDGDFVAISDEPTILHEIHRKVRMAEEGVSTDETPAVSEVPVCWDGKPGFKTVISMREMETILQDYTGLFVSSELNK